MSLRPNGQFHDAWIIHWALGYCTIIVVSSSPQIRYPDCYGIDMSKMGEFIAFNAAVELAKEKDKLGCMKELLDRCKELQRSNQLDTENVVKQFYKLFTTDEITKKIAQLCRIMNMQLIYKYVYISMHVQVVLVINKIK